MTEHNRLAWVVAFGVFVIIIGGFLLRHMFGDIKLLSGRVTSLETGQDRLSGVVTNVETLVEAIGPIVEAERQAGIGRTQALENQRKVLISLEDLIQRQNDCTTPEGKCYQTLRRDFFNFVQGESTTTRELVIREINGRMVVETIEPGAPNPPHTITRCLIDAGATVLNTQTIAKVVCPIP